MGSRARPDVRTELVPIYDYKCETCNNKLTMRLPIDDRDNPQHCEICNQRMFRLMAVPAIKFKGSGFYSNDKNGDDEAF
jgi:putative FmdB family regulatory protein